MVEKPEKVFPCDCCGEGLVVSTFDAEYGDIAVVARDGEREDDIDHYTLDISFWGDGNYQDGRLTWRKIFRHIWYVLRYRNVGWTDMVSMRPNVARNFANHILYRVERMEKKRDQRRDELKKQKDDLQYRMD